MPVYIEIELFKWWTTFHRPIGNSNFKKDVLARRIERIALNAQHISVYQEDALALLKRRTEFLPAKSLTYLDPPYHVKGQGLYRNFYQHSDHESIARLLQSSNFLQPWVVSYDGVQQIREMYTASKLLNYTLNYTAHRRYVGGEVMFFSPRLNVPDEELPQSPMAMAA